MWIGTSGYSPRMRRTLRFFLVTRRWSAVVSSMKGPPRADRNPGGRPTSGCPARPTREGTRPARTPSAPRRGRAVGRRCARTDARNEPDRPAHPPDDERRRAGLGCAHSPAARAATAAGAASAAWRRRGVEADDVRVERLDDPGQRNDVEDALSTREQVDHRPVERARTELVPVRTRLAEATSEPRSSRRHSTARRANCKEIPASSSCLITLTRAHPIGVHPTRTAPLGRGQRWLKRARAGPIVELPVGDPDETADLRPAETHRPGSWTPRSFTPPMLTPLRR